MLFVNLAGLLAGSQSLTLMLVPEDGKIRLTLMPKAKNTSEGALNTPLSLVGTAEELDAGWVNAIQKFTGSYQSLEEQVESTTSILDAATKAQQEKANAKLKSSSKVVPGGKKTSSGDDDDDLGCGAGCSVPSPSAVAPDTTAAAVSTDNLFD